EGKRGRRGGGVGAVEELQEAARAASLHLVGVYGDMRTSLGMQALTALALLVTLPGGCAAALAAPAAPTALPPLLTCRAQDAQQAATALVSVLAHAGTPAQRATLVGWPGLLPALTEAAGAATAATAAFASVALADLALEPECAAAVAAPATLSALLALLAAPLALLSEISNPSTNCAPEHTQDEHRGSLSQSPISSPGNPSRQPVTLAGSKSPPAELLLPSQPFQGSLCFSSLARLPSLDRGSDSSRASPGTSPSAAPLAYLVCDTPKAAVRLSGRGVVEGGGCAALTPPPPRFGRSTLTGTSPPSPASYQQRSPTLALTPLPLIPLLPSLGAGAASPAQGGSNAVSGGCHKDQDGNMAQTKRSPLKLPALSAAVGLTEAPVVGDPRSPNPAAAEGVALGATPMLPQASALPRPSPPPLAPTARPAEGAEAGDTGRRDSSTDSPVGAGVRAGQQSVEGPAQRQAEAKGLVQAPAAPEVPIVSAAFSQSLAVSLAGAMGAAGTFQNLAAAPDLATALLDLGLLPLVQELLAAVQSMGQGAAPPGLPMEVLDAVRGLELLLMGVVANLAACGPDTVTALLAPPHQPLAALLVEALCRCGQHQASARALDSSAPSAHAHPQPDKLSLSGVQLLAVPGPPPPPPKEAKGTAPAAAAAAAAGQWEEVGSSVAGNVQNAASPSLHTGMRESTLGMAPTGVVEKAGPGARVSGADSQFSGHDLQQLTALALGALYNLLAAAVPEPSSFHASGPGPAHSSLTLPVLPHTLLSNAPGFAALTVPAGHPTQLTPGQLPWPAEGHLYGQARPAASNSGMQRLPETPPSSVPGRDEPSVAAVSLTSLNSIAPPSLVSLMDALQSDDFDDAPNHAALSAKSLRDEESAEATVGEGASTRSNDVVVCAGQVAWKPPDYLVARQRVLLDLMWKVRPR
ncbi:hypothetical protein QJQ45_027558, partial [Haematococcus lacustris]